MRMRHEHARSRLFRFPPICEEMKNGTERALMMLLHYSGSMSRPVCVCLALSFAGCECVCLSIITNTGNSTIGISPERVGLVSRRLASHSSSDAAFTTHYHIFSVVG